MLTIITVTGAFVGCGAVAAATPTRLPAFFPRQLFGHFKATYVATGVRNRLTGDVYHGFEIEVEFTSVRFISTSDGYQLAHASYHLLGHPVMTSSIKGLGTCHTYYSLAGGRLDRFLADITFDGYLPVNYKLGGTMYGDLHYYVYRETCNGKPVSVTFNDTIESLPTPALSTMVFAKNGAVTKVELVEGGYPFTMGDFPAEAVVEGVLVP
jgi:hypothetical protein